MDRQTLKKIETGCNCSFWKLGVSQTVFQISFMLLFTWAIECSRLRDNRVRGIEKAQTLRVFSTIWEPGTGCTCNKVWETCLFDKKLWLCHSQAIDLFTDTAAILNLLVLRSIMGCPGGTRSVFTLAENFTVYFSGQRQSLLHLNAARRSFFPITIGTLRSNDADGKENVKKQ